MEKELKTCQAWNLQAGSSKTFLLCQFHIFKFLSCRQIWIAYHRSTLQKGISFPISFVNVVLLYKILHFIFLSIMIVFFIKLGSKISALKTNFSCPPMVHLSWLLVLSIVKPAPDILSFLHNVQVVTFLLSTICSFSRVQ